MFSRNEMKSSQLSLDMLKAGISYVGSIFAVPKVSLVA